MKGTKLTGTVNMGGPDKPVDEELSGPLFADGASFADVVGCLPLAEGYSTTFRSPDLAP
jgi:hypothetical protein